MRKIKLLSQQRLFDATSTLNELCSRLHNCAICPVQSECQRYFDSQMIGKGQPTPEAAWQFLNLLVTGNNGGKQ